MVAGELNTHMDENKILEKRFIATVLAIVMAGVMLWCQRIGAPNFEQIIIWVVGLFVAGGSSDKWAQYYAQTKTLKQ